MSCSEENEVGVAAENVWMPTTPFEQEKQELILGQHARYGCCCSGSREFPVAAVLTRFISTVHLPSDLIAVEGICRRRGA